MSNPRVICKKCGQRRFIRFRVSGVPIGTPKSLMANMKRKCELRKASGEDCQLLYYAGVDVAGLRRMLAGK